MVMADELKQVEGEIVSQEMDPSSPSDYRVQFFKDNNLFFWSSFSLLWIHGLERTLCESSEVPME